VLFTRSFVLFAALSYLRAQDPTVRLPRAYKLLFENEHVRVIHVLYAPGERLPVHSHPDHPTVYVYLSDSGPVRFEHTEMDALTRRPVTTGAFRVSPGRPEKHAVTNLANVPSEFLRVELKAIPFNVAGLLHRGDRPFDLKVSGTTREFTHARLTVDRLIAAAGAAPVAVPPSTRGFLLVALTPSTLASGRLGAGEVRWCAAAERVTLKGGDSAPAHVLRIEIMD
jgi:mannose-6-phosphate isomerase-like protein (cupin superfamily)